jgi:hypothetical protein
MALFTSPAGQFCQESRHDPFALADDLGLAVKKLARKNRRLQAELREFVLEIFSAS